MAIMKIEGRCDKRLAQRKYDQGMTAIFWTRGRSFPFCDLKNQTQNAYDQNTDLNQI